MLGFLKKEDGDKSVTSATDENGNVLPPEEVIDHVVTQEDLDNNPDLVENGVQVGETIQIPKVSILTDEEKAAMLEEEKKAIEQQGQNGDQSNQDENTNSQNGPETTDDQKSEESEETNEVSQTAHDQEDHSAPADELERSIRKAGHNDHPFSVDYWADGSQVFFLSVNDYRLKNFLMTTGRVVETDPDIEVGEDQVAIVIK